jgi:hypothetical protein
MNGTSLTVNMCMQRKGNTKIANLSTIRLISNVMNEILIKKKFLKTN